MRDHVPGWTDASPLPRAYAALLGEAASLAAKVMNRIHALNDRYPGAIPGPPMAQLERGHTDPAGERRGALRLPGGPGTAAVRPDNPAGSATDAAVVDRSAGGLALRLPMLAPARTVLAVRLPGGGGWRPVQVRHCRPDGGGWLVGCEFATDRAAD